MAQCRKAAKHAKGWDIASPCATSEVHVPSPTGPYHGDKPNIAPVQGPTAAFTPAIAGSTNTAGSPSTDAEDALAKMIYKITASWDLNEVWSIRIPVLLNDMTDSQDETDLRMRLFFCFNHTTLLRHGLLGALGLPRKGHTTFDIELLTTRATANERAAKNGVPPTDLIRALPPGVTTSDLRAEIRRWFPSHTPTNVPDWTSRRSPTTSPSTDTAQYPRRRPP